MKIVRYQLDELNAARKLQKDLLGLHVPVPILSWAYKVFDENDEQIEDGIGKSNSYTRNALNALAWYLGQASNAIFSTAFNDGVLSYKDIDGTVHIPNQYTSYPNRCNARVASTNSIIRLGSSNAAESLDSHTITNAGTQLATQVASEWNAATRILTTILMHNVANTSGSNISIYEAGVYQYAGIESMTSTETLDWLMMVRDVFAEIVVPNNGRIQWIYTFEVSYPNP